MSLAVDPTRARTLMTADLHRGYRGREGDRRAARDAGRYQSRRRISPATRRKRDWAAHCNIVPAPAGGTASREAGPFAKTGDVRE
jgi:hypothetical protein